MSPGKVQGCQRCQLYTEGVGVAREGTKIGHKNNTRYGMRTPLHSRGATQALPGVPFFRVAPLDLTFILNTWSRRAKSHPLWHLWTRRGWAENWGGISKAAL